MQQQACGLCRPDASRLYLFVFCFGGEEHPDICKESGEPECGVYWANEASQTTLVHDSVCFPDATLWIWPVLNAASRHIPVKPICRQGQILCIALQNSMYIDDTV